MITNKRGQELHSRKVGDGPLSDAERDELTAWYAQMDAEEAAVLNNAPLTEELAEMRAKVADVNARIIAATQYVNELLQQNEQLKRERAELRQQLAERLKLAA